MGIIPFFYLSKINHINLLEKLFKDNDKGNTERKKEPI